MAASGARKASDRLSDSPHIFWLKSNINFTNTYYLCMAGMADICNHVVVFRVQYSICFGLSD